MNAPDLYIPFMAVCTYCLLASISKLAHGSFTPDSMYALVSLPGPLTGACSAAAVLHAVPGKGPQGCKLRSHSHSSAKVRLPCCSCASVTEDRKLGIWAAGQSGIWGLGSALLCPKGAHVHAWDIKCHPIPGAAGICWIPICAHLHILAGAADSRSAP